MIGRDSYDSDVHDSWWSKGFNYQLSPTIMRRLTRALDKGPIKVAVCDLLLQKLQGDCAPTFACGIGWVTIVSYDWLRVSKATINQSQLSSLSSPLQRKS